jgi:O-antigen/teichoic acid export membrane protein
MPSNMIRRRPASAGAPSGGPGKLRRLAGRLPVPRQAFARLGWGVADQAISSLTNYAVVIFVAKKGGPAALGAFSLAYVTYGVVLNVSRGLATEPLVVRFSGKDVRIWRRAVASCTGTALVVGLVLGSLVAGAAGVIHGTAGLAFLSLGLLLPGLMLQDSWRLSFFALGRGSQAFLNDTIWAVLVIPALILVEVTGHGTVFWFVWAWGASATVAAVIGPIQARVIPRPGRAPKWLYQHRDLGPRYLAANMSQSVSAQLRTYGVALMLGLAAQGFVQGANTLGGPYQVMLFGIYLVMTPEAARVLQRAPERLPRFCMMLTGGLALMGLVWGAALLLCGPLGVGPAILGPRIWPGAYRLVIPMMLAGIGQAASAGAGAGLQALAAAKRALRAAIWSAILFLCCTLPGAYLDGAFGTMAGAAVAAWAGGAIMWFQLRAALRESRQLKQRPRDPDRITQRPAEPDRIMERPAEPDRITERPAESDLVMERPAEPDLVKKRPPEPDRLAGKHRRAVPAPPAEG